MKKTEDGRPKTEDRSFDPLDLAVMSHAVAMIAEEMGTVLERGALSPNIRERRDASSALFDVHGTMVAQAAHIPVHLGAMPESVRAVRAKHPEPGDVFILNDPFHGGSHLPDLTVVEAIDIDGEIAGYTAIRAHHADVGGMSPGSMPQGATELVQEGIILPPVRLERRGVPRADAERRMAAQASDEERRALATWVIENRGDLPALDRQVEEVWRDLERRRTEGDAATNS